MKTAICHYSFHRTLAEEGWTLEDFVRQCGSLEIDGVDFHQRFLPSPEEAPEAMHKALEGTDLELSSLSLSTNFNTEGDEFVQEIEKARKWIEAASRAGVNISRIFGGHIPDRTDTEQLASAMEKVCAAMKELAPAAEESNVVLALENHGGVPGLGEEQVSVIEKVDSPFLKATVDVGNYMSCGQDSVEGVSLAAPHCAYVHWKDMKKTDSGAEPTVVGEGDIDHAACLKILQDSGYSGYVALEYEGPEDERDGVSKSIAFIKTIMGT